MTNTRIFPGRRHVFALVLLFVTLGMMLTACDNHVLALDCIGASGDCGPLTPTPDARSLEAKARAILASKPLVTDPLSKQDGYNWAIGSGCSFQSNSYDINYTDTTGGSYFCNAGKLNYADAAIAMDVSLIAGNSAGIVFRQAQDLSYGYEFLVGNGKMLMAVWGNGHIIRQPIPRMSNSAVHTGASVNKLLVIVKGEDFQCFVNGIFVGEVQDSAIPGPGRIGVAVDYNAIAAAQFTNLAIYSAG
jgi:hypothetical protein